MSAAGCVGRIGGLAVTLGVGTAIFTGHGVAWADSGAVDQSSTASSQADAGPAKADRAGSRRVRLPRPDDVTGRQSSAQSATDALKKSSSGATTTPTMKTHVNKTRVEKTFVGKTPNVPTAQSSAPSVEAGPTETGAETTGAVNVPETTSTLTTVSPPKRSSDGAANIVNAVVKGFTGSSPTEPSTDSLASSVVLAAARRESSTPTITYTPTINVNGGVITGTNPVTAPASQRPLTYNVVSDPSGGGKVNLDKTTGNFTYLPYSASSNPDGTPKFEATEQFKVLVAQTTRLDAVLEKLPTLGLLVKPILLRLHQAPVLGELLAPIIGDATVVPVTVDDAALAAENVDPIALTTTVVSFDGTPISVNYFPALDLATGQDAPTILNGPSLATAGYTNPAQPTTVSGLVPGLQPLRADGYNVVTWDPRGEYASGGVLQLDSPDYEAKDVSAIITWVAGQPETKFDPGITDRSNPLIGMVGGSYGGGIQLTSAGTDARIDAIAPGIAWNNLDTTLYPNQAFKTSFSALLLLSLVVSGSRINPEIYSGILTGALLGVLTPGQRAFLNAASPSNVVDDITVPTLLLQGTVDDLFPLQQAVTNLEALQANSTAPVKMIWYCGGHGQCLDPVDPAAQTAFLTAETLAWMDTYVKDKGEAPPATVPEVPNFQWVDEHGDLYSSQYLPTPGSDLYTDSTPIMVSHRGGLLPIVPVLGGSGPQTQSFFPLSLALASAADNAINVKIPNPNADPDAPTYIVGAPQVTMTYAGVGTSRVVYAQLVDHATGRVLGNILTPIPVTMDGATHTVSVSMEDIAYTMTSGDSLTLQIVGSATPYENFTSYGLINVAQVALTLPSVNPGNVTPEGSFAGEPTSSGSGLLGV